MMKIVASLAILGLCANVCFGAAPTSTSQSGAFSSSVLNSSAIKVISGTNATDTANWDSSTAAGTSGTPAATSAGVYVSYTWFGPGATNDTSYIWGIPSTGETSSTVSSIRKRTINNTIVGWGNDTTELSVIGDTAITTTIQWSEGDAWGVGPGYLAAITAGTDGLTPANKQAWVTLISGVSGSASTTKLTTTSDVTTASTSVACTVTTFGVGNIWYDIGAGAFFYTYWKNVVTQTMPASGTTCTAVTATTTTNIYLGGIYVNGTAYWTAPITVSAATAGNTIGSLMGGGDNWLNSSNIYIAYADTTASPSIVYSSKTTKSSATTAVASFGSLIKSTSSVVATTTTTMTYTPASIWSSNYTYGITVSNLTSVVDTSPVSSATTYAYTNFINGSSTGVDSGISSSGAGGFGGFYGWQLNTGYTIVAGYESSTSPNPITYTLATYYANGTANGTAVTAGTLTYAGAQFYEDVNGTQWIGWVEADTGNEEEWVYSAYLAKFQGQLNVPSGANVLSVLSVFALFLVSIFAF